MLLAAVSMTSERCLCFPRCVYTRLVACSPPWPSSWLTVSHHLSGRLRRGELGQAEPPRRNDYRRDRKREPASDPRRAPARSAPLPIFWTFFVASRLGQRCGRELRSRSPASPSVFDVADWSVRPPADPSVAANPALGAAVVEDVRALGVLVDRVSQVRGRRCPQPPAPSATRPPTSPQE